MKRPRYYFRHCEESLADEAIYKQFESLDGSGLLRRIEAPRNHDSVNIDQNPQKFVFRIDLTVFS